MPNSSFAKFTSRTLFVLAVVIAVLGTFSFYNYYVFCQRVESLKASGEPVSLQDFLHHVEQPQNDAMTYLTRIDKDLVSELIAAIPPDFETGVAPLTMESAIEFAALARQHPELFADLRMAAAANDIRIRFDDSGDFELKVTYLLQLGRVMGMQIQVLGLHDQPNEAIELSNQLIQLSRKIERLPSLLNYLLAMSYRVTATTAAYRVLQSGPEIDNDIVAEFLDSLQQVDATDGFVNAVYFERAAMLDSVLNQDGDQNDDLAGLKSESVQQLAKWAPGIAAAFWGNQYLDDLEIAIEHGKSPLTVQFPPAEENAGWLPGMSGDMTRVFDNLRNSVGQKQVLIRALVIAMALQFDGASVAESGISQADLIRLGVPASMTEDPFTGKTMVVKQVEGQLHVFSLGPDQVEGVNPETGVNDDAGLPMIR